MHASRGRVVAVLVAVVVVVALVATQCTGDGGDDDNSGPGDDFARRVSSGAFDVRLSTGQPTAAEPDPVRVVGGDPLDESRIDEITSRLPELPDDSADRQEFNRPTETRPPPIVGRTIDQPIGATGDAPPPDVPSGPLEVLRFQPEGDVDIAPFVSVTFNQPMVPLGTLDQLDAADVPVSVTPELPGRWRWIGTRTLRFEHESGVIDRLPMATSYRVEIPAGTTSQSGGELAAAVSWEFQTPPVKVLSVDPLGDQMPLVPVLVATFDQIVDAAAVLDALTVTVDGDPVDMRVATPDEIDADDEARQASEQVLDGRWVAIRPTEPLPPDTRVELTFAEGMASSEGPSTTEAAQSFDGRTYPAFEVAGTECGWGSTCQPGLDLIIEMSTRIDPDTFDPAAIEISPELPGAAIRADGTRIVVRGITTAQTTYEVTLPADLRDIFGQPLGDDQTATFEVGDARPALRWIEYQLVTVDPFSASPSLLVSSINHDQLRVRTFAVGPDDFDDYVELLDRWDRESVDDLPWEAQRDDHIDTEPDAGVLGETAIALPEIDGGGHVLVAVEPPDGFRRTDDNRWENQPILVWVQSTTIGLDAIYDQSELVVWATDLTDGSPIGGVDVQVGGDTVTTDGDGLATATTAGQLTHLLATHDGQNSILGGGELRYMQGGPRTDIARWHVSDDRGLYQPGETAHLKGWVRRLTLSGDAQLTRIGDGATVAWTAMDAFGNAMATGEAPLNAAGGFDLAVEIPADASLGAGGVDMQVVGVSGLDHTSMHHQLTLAEFRRPEFEVRTRAESSGPYLVTDPATMAVTAEYFAGGALPDAPVTWTVTTRPGTYSPPGWDRFDFGIWTPWWFESVGHGMFDSDIGPCCFPPAEEDVKTFEGRTDAAGEHFLRMDFDGSPDGEPVVVSANAAITDVNRQQLADTTEILVHAGTNYVGLRSEDTFVDSGQPLTVEAIVTDIDGEVVPGQAIEVTMERLEWREVNGEWVEEGVDILTCEITSAVEPVECALTPPTGGRYRVTALVADEAGGSNRTEITRWVSGARNDVPNRGVAQEELTLVPDAETYAGGDTARVLVQAPFSEGSGLLTVNRNGIASTQVFEVRDGSAVVEVAITDAMVPGLDLLVEVVGTTPRDDSDSPRPAFAVGTLPLDIPPAGRTLDVDVTPRDPELTPGDDTAVDVVVTDASGAPVSGAELSVVVVDEAVLSLTGYELADPLASMYEPFPSYLTPMWSRSSILISRPADPSATEGDEAAFASPDDSGGGFATDSLEAATAEMADMDGTARNAVPQATAQPVIEVRSNFDAVAVFAPEVTTDAQGRASVDVPLPDNLTRYRVMVTAAAGDAQFGTGESNITARLPVQARPSAPRFLNFGDTFELPIVVQNQTDEAIVADVVVEATNLTLTGAAGVQVEVPANDRVEVRFPAAADDVGTARLRATVVAGDHTDATTISLPVYTPTTAEAFATYGVIDDGGIAQTVLTPEGVIAQFGSLDVTTSSTSLQTLTDAVIDLTEYRFDHVDARASRVLAVVALRDVLGAFAVEGAPDRATLDAAVADDIAGIERLQSGDGGFGTWRAGIESDPYRTIQATHALVAARDAGYAVDEGVLSLAMAYLMDIDAKIPSVWPDEVKATLGAYALHVRFVSGDRDTAGADALYERHADILRVDALAWLWPVVSEGPAAAIGTEIDNRVTETPAAATFTTDYGEDAHLVLASDRRTDGIVLDALIRMRPQSDLIPKVVTGLIGNQRKGSWGNVQENSFILLALKSYFDAYESTTPDFVARVWLGDLYAAESPHRGRSIDSTNTRVPMAELLGRVDPTLVLAKDGPGRLYYRFGLRYAPDDLTVDARDAGFVVDRTYEAVDDPDDVQQRDDGTWVVRAGANVRVNLTMVADSRRTNMALIDPTPAGFEILNPTLATAIDEPPAEGDDGGDGPPVPLRTWGWGTWFDHQNQRDDRAEAFAAYLPAGTYEYSYVARATTPGTFVTPPARAEELYSPEVFGRSASATVVVSDDG
ncbi:MAG: hypothetical protein JJE52_04835 [Acidimicrobiia bacterium]|nr:hypothetical protein [Acidimicrobiia bacterium]